MGRAIDGHAVSIRLSAQETEQTRADDITGFLSLTAEDVGACDIVIRDSRESGRGPIREKAPV